MSNVIIPSEHQSSPKTTDLQRAMQTAANEIYSGDFQEKLTENIFGKKETEFWDTGLSGLLATHPRVEDALRTLRTQVQDKTNTEYLEKAEQLHELNTHMASGDQWAGQGRWQGKTNREMRLVNLLTPKEFIDKLLAAKINAAHVPIVETDYKADDNGILRLCETERTSGRICLGRKLVRGCVGVFANVRGQHTYINKLQYPVGAEWTVMRFDEYNVPTNEEFHGWRSAVLSLIVQGVITEREAEKAFGKVVENPASLFYRQQLADYRNGKEGAA